MEGKEHHTPMSGKHNTRSKPSLPRLAGAIAAGAAISATMAAAGHPNSADPPSAANLRLLSTTFTDADPSAFGKAGAFSAKIASTSIDTATARSAAQSVAPSAVPVSAGDAIRLAKSQVGVHETNGRGGGTKYQKWYAKSDRAKITARRDGGSVTAYRNAAWCSMFISWIGDTLNFSDQMGSDAWTVSHAKWFKRHGRWGHRPKPGAVVFYSWNGGGTNSIDHVGLVIKKLGGGRIKAVEGNVNNRVIKRIRSTSSVVGYGYPDYAK